MASTTRASDILIKDRADFVPLDMYADAQHVAHGAAADIWKVSETGLPGVHGINHPCVQKVLRVHSLSSGLAVSGTEIHMKLWQDFLKDYRDRVDRWKSLSHKNVVRVLGLGAGLNLRVELCEKRSVREYLQTVPKPDPTKLDIISHVLEGLDYLHSRTPPIVHGNLNAGKLFIDAGGITKIGEFGLAALCQPFAAFVPSVSFVGLSRWLSPELLDVDLDTTPEPTTASDIWALGCVLFEIVAETVPYSGYNYDMLVEECIIAGEPPGRRGKHFDDYPFNLFWPLLTKCWERQPDRRPPASSLSQQFSSVLQGSPSTTLANAENTVAVTSLPGSSADVRTSTVLPPRPEAYGLSQTPPQRSSPTQPAAAPTGDEDHDMNTWPPNAPKFSSQEVPPEQTEERHTSHLLPGSRTSDGTGARVSPLFIQSSTPPMSSAPMVSPSDSNIFARFTSSGLNRSRTGPRYNFRPPDGDVTWLSQLLECANQCGFKLSWSHECTQHSGLDLHTLTPLINSVPYTACSASARRMSEAKNNAAELLINSGALNPWLLR